VTACMCVQTVDREPEPLTEVLRAYKMFQDVDGGGRGGGGGGIRTVVEANKALLGC